MTTHCFGRSDTTLAVLSHLAANNQALDFCLAKSFDRVQAANAILEQLGLSLSVLDLDALIKGNMTDDFLFETFEFHINHFDNNSSLDGAMFETYGKELAYVKRVYKDCPSRVWTYQSHGESDCVAFTNEMVLSHCLGYLVTSQAMPTPSRLVFISDPF